MTAVFHRIGVPTPDRFTHSLEQVLNYPGQVTFDGIYTSIWDNREAIKELAQTKPVILFAAGDTLGTEGFLTKEQLLTMVEDYDCLLAWHTWSHPVMITLTDEQIRHELDAPDWFPRVTFAYPHGEFNERVIELVKEAGYSTAYSTTQGNSDKYSLYREYV